MSLFGPKVELTGIDTNVLLRMLLQDDPVQGPLAAELFRGLGSGARGFITQVTLVETYWVLSRAKGLSKSQCLGAIEQLVATEALEFEDGEAVVRALILAEAGADFADALIQGSLELFGVQETVTFDRTAADRLGWRLLGPSARSGVGE